MTSTDSTSPETNGPADYRATVFLPTTDFPMRAGLPQKEPDLLARWQALDLYRRQREAARGRDKFILHDGPPYANGRLHLGHALNKILKDMINRAQQMLGYDAPYVPGWDCHGLPIEWKIEEQYRKKGQDKDQVNIVAFRQECRRFADHWIGVQSEEFQRLGVIGDWSNPYTTMAFPAEAAIVRELGRFLLDGSLYRGAKPVLWSPVEKTALAEAEVEYHDHTSTMIWVRFAIEHTRLTALEGGSVAIWTTTPWTMAGNRAIAFGAGHSYVVIRVTDTTADSLARRGERIALASDLVADVCAQAGITDHEICDTFDGAELAGTICRHPWHGKGYDFAVPLLAGDFVTTDQGTGFVHIAPGHGEDDWRLGRANDIPVPDTVGDDGRYLEHVPLLAGEHVYKVADRVIELMINAGALLAHGRLVHSYPHSWRSKAPLIFRTTPQWFISMEATGLRARALAAIDATRFVPAQGANRIRSMVAERPDWCVSRQRAWGVPITVFVHTATGEPLRDARVLDRIVAAVAEHGADVWFDGDPRRFLGNDHDPAEYEPVMDILDVWFDSGSTHAFVLEPRDDLHSPADLYLEGSDQHRGWFQSSLLESCGTRGRAPYKAVLTHGFINDEHGRKMSKALGNGIEPQDVVKESGADILRLWVASSDYTEDLRVGKEILKQTSDLYRRLRNTLRYTLGNLAGFDEAERITDVAEMPELERWVLHRLWQLDGQLRQACVDYGFHGFFTQLHTFCAVDLSAVYFDIRKDALYCDPVDAARRRAARTVLDHIYGCLVTWLAPFIPFTTEEAWLSRHRDDPGSVHLQLFPEIPGSWRNDGLAARWDLVRGLRRAVTGALELERAAKRIGASTQAAPAVFVPQAVADACAGLDLAELCITSGLSVTVGPAPAAAYRLPDATGPAAEIGVMVALADGTRCERCWRVLPEVGRQSRPDLCARCDDAVDRHVAARGGAAA